MPTFPEGAAFTITVQEIAELVGATKAGTPVSEAKMPHVQHALDLAVVLVDTALEDQWRPIEVPAYTECVRRTAKAVYQRSSSEAETTLNADGTVGINVANDPLRTSWPLIKRYVNRL